MTTTQVGLLTQSYKSKVPLSFSVIQVLSCTIRFGSETILEEPVIILIVQKKSVRSTKIPVIKIDIGHL